MKTILTEITNMCYIELGSKILVQRVSKGALEGLTFVGGHVEAGESIEESVIREVYEETGLVISSPKLVGVRNWSVVNENGKENFRYLAFLYMASKFSGELKSSDEGEVFFIEKSELLNHKLANDVENIFEFYEKFSKASGNGEILSAGEMFTLERNEN